MPRLITRRSLLRTLAASPALRTARSAPAGNGRNVLLLMSDEHSPHVVGCFGNAVIHTPAIDSLAARGTRCSEAYCQNPVCVPSRAAILTGRMPSNVGVYGNVANTMDPTVTTMAQVFQNAGYVTSWIGKTHWAGNSHFPTPPHGKLGDTVSARRKKFSRLPQDAFVCDWPVTEELDTIAKNQALEFLDRNHSRPFFAGVSFRKPHFPFYVQERFYSLYEGRIDPPRVNEKIIAELPLSSQKERETYGFAALTDVQVRKALAMYYGMVTYMDSLIGEILKKVDDLGLRENTIILYTADHGEMGAEHGLWYKNSMYEASARIPHVWSFPKVIPQGAEITAPVMNMEIFPTLCDLCGLPKPQGLEGRSILPLLNRTEDGSTRYALSENFRGSFSDRMLRTGRWKYCYFKDDREQLFDLQSDLGEIVNLAGNPKHRDLVASLKSRALSGWKSEKTEEFKRKARDKSNTLRDDQ